jgi:conjugation system TraG family ATPase
MLYIMAKELKDVLPILTVEKNCLLSRQGDITFGFRARLPEIFSLSNQDYENLHQTWVKAFRILPRQSVFHKQDWFTEAKWKPDPAKAAPGFLSRSSDRFFFERPWLDHDCYIYLTKKPAGRKLSSSALSNLIRRSIVPAQALKPALLDEFQENVYQFKRILEDSGFVQLEALDNGQLMSQDHAAGAVEKYCFLLEDGDSGIRDISYKDGISIGEKRCLLYTLSSPADLPSVCGPRINYEPYSSDRTKFGVGFASSLGQLLPYNHIYNQYLFIEDPQKTIRQLESKKLRLQSLAAYSRENAISRDAVDEFLNEAVGSGRIPVKAHFNVLVWTAEPLGLKEITSGLSSALSRLDAVAKSESDGAPQIHWAGIPGNEADFPMNDCFDSFPEQAACFLNLESCSRSSLSPFGLRLGDRLNGMPLHVDISDEPMKRGIITNRNKFILGPSGSGKSFFTNHMVRSYYEQGTHVVLVDVGHSYKGLCELVHGYYFTYSENHPIRFNPFHLAEVETPDTEKKESIKTLLLALWKKDKEEYRRAEYVALSNALQTYYEKDVPFRDFNSFYEFLKSDFGNLLAIDQVKEKEFDLANFLYVLRPFYRGGEFDYLLNARENLNLMDQQLIVFELDNIKDHPILFPVVTLIIMEVFISKLRNLKGIRKMILIEEAWKAIAREGMAEYIKYLFKTVRKFYGEAVVVTQEVEDIISSPIVKQAIINNSDCKILLDQSKYQNKFDQIQELLGLTDKEKTMVLSINRANDPFRKYKEVFISLGGIFSRVYRTEVSPEEYFAYTTEETEKLKVQQYAARYGSIEKGISLLANESVHL